MASKLYSMDQQLLVARANRILKAAMQRALGGSEGGDEMEKAVTYALKRVHAVMGEDTDALKLSGADEEKVREVVEGADYITSAKRLTLKGLKEQKAAQLSGFYGKPADQITAAEEQLFTQARDSGLLAKMVEIGLNYEQVRGIQEEFGEEMSVRDLFGALNEYVNNTNGVRESTGSLYDFISQRYAGEV